MTVAIIYRPAAGRASQLMLRLLLKEPSALMAAARRMYWWYAAAASAPMNGPAQKIHCVISYAWKMLAGLLHEEKQSRP